MFRRKVKLLLSALCVLVIIIALCFAPRRAPVDVTVTFTGFTNLNVTFTGFTNFTKRSVTAASFCVSNSGRVPVFEWPAPSGFEFKRENSEILLGHFSPISVWAVGKPKILKPGEVANLYITPPQTALDRGESGTALRKPIGD
jgi:hypothetical protein